MGNNFRIDRNRMSVQIFSHKPSQRSIHWWPLRTWKYRKPGKHVKHGNGSNLLDPLKTHWMLIESQWTSHWIALKSCKPSERLSDRLRSFVALNALTNGVIRGQSMRELLMGPMSGQPSVALIRSPKIFQLIFLMQWNDKIVSQSRETVKQLRYWCPETHSSLDRHSLLTTRLTTQTFVAIWMIRMRNAVRYRISLASLLPSIVRSLPVFSCEPSIDDWLEINRVSHWFQYWYWLSANETIICDKVLQTILTNGFPVEHQSNARAGADPTISPDLQSVDSSQVSNNETLFSVSLLKKSSRR